MQWTLTCDDATQRYTYATEGKTSCNFDQFLFIGVDTKEKRRVVFHANYQGPELFNALAFILERNADSELPLWLAKVLMWWSRTPTPPPPEPQQNAQNN